MTLWLPVGLTLLPSFDRGTRRPCVAAAFRLPHSNASYRAGALNRL